MLNSINKKTAALTVLKEINIKYLNKAISVQAGDSVFDYH